MYISQYLLSIKIFIKGIYQKDYNLVEEKHTSLHVEFIKHEYAKIEKCKISQTFGKDYVRPQDPQPHGLSWRICIKLSH